MRYVRYAMFGVTGVALVGMALANRDLVTLQLVPDGLTPVFGFQAAITLPLFVVVLLAVSIGILVGYGFEWLREAKHRREAGVKTRQVRRLEREVSQLKGDRDQGKDEVLAILDEAS
jgi:uncharacterized integral membrane protein